MSIRHPACVHAPRRDAARTHSAPAGFTLIELMVAMLLGLIVIAGAASVFLAGQQTYRTNQALVDVQENARVAFEMMARDIRTAGMTGCDNSGRVVNVLKNGPFNGGTDWWANWNNALQGFTSSQTDPSVTVGTGAAQKVTGTVSLMLIGAQNGGVSVKTSTPGAFTFNEASPGFQAGDIIVVCDTDHAALVQISSVSAGTYSYDTSGTPGNCTKDLSYPTSCSGSGSYNFHVNGMASKLSAADWYVGNNADGGKSLYRRAVETGSTGVAAPVAEEMVRGVTGLALAFHQVGNVNFVAADAVTNWASVDAVQATLTLQSSDQRAGTDAKPITRTLTSITTVRNRVN